jgi:hypothetical protein
MAKQRHRPRLSLRRLSLSPFLRRRWPLLLLLAASLIMRILLFQSVIPRVHTDSVTYFELSNLDPVRTPGYPLFLEIIQFFNDLFTITPHYLRFIVFVQVFFLGLINTYLVYALAKFLTRSEIFSLAMGVIFNLDFYVLGFDFLLLTETLSLTFLGLTLIFYMKIFEPNKRAPYWAGFFAVCLLLTRPSFAGLFVILIGLSWLVHARPPGGHGFIRKFGPAMAVFLLFNLAGIGGWSVRNMIRHGYFGISTILPYQLGYFTQHFYRKYKTGHDAEMDRYAAILAEEKGQPFEFRRRLAEDMNMKEAQISKVFLRLNLKMIKDNFADYLRLIPRAASSYYRYNWDWTAPQNKRIFRRNPLTARLFRFFFRIYAGIFKNAFALVTLVLLIPAGLLITTRKKKPLFHQLCLVEGTIHYNFLICVLLTPGGINNMRYRAPVEPLILLVFYAALFLFSRFLFRAARKKPSFRP